MAKVLLVNPALAYSSWKADLTRPSPDSVFIRLGLAYLAGALRGRGHETRLADLRTLSGWEEYAEIVKDFRPEFLGVSIHSVEHSYAVKAAQIAKKAHPPITAVAGGIHPTMFPEACLETGAFDHVIQGEGEISFPELAENPSDFPAVFWGKTPDLDKVPFPDREIWLDYRKRMWCEPFGLGRFSFPLPTAELINTRGCPYRCTFCCGPGEHQLYTRLKGDGSRIPYIRGRSVESVIVELEMLIRKYGVRSAMFHDDQFIVSRKWVEEFVDKLHSRGIVKSGFQWVTSSRADIICRNEDLLGRMARAGLAMLIVGFESFSPRILRWFNKGTRVDENFRAAEVCRKHGIRIWANYILGVRTDTGWHPEDDILTVAGALKVQPIHLSPALYTPVPGSILFDYYKENGLIDASLSSVEDMSNRGKMAAKVKGIGYPFLESLMMTDSVLDEEAELKEFVRDYSPEMGDVDEEDYIRRKSVEAAAGIIRLIQTKARKMTERCRAFQAEIEVMQGRKGGHPGLSANAMGPMLKRIAVFEPIMDKGGADPTNGRLSVIIPVLNGGERLGLMLNRLRRQKKIADVEIIVLDSGSTDGSQDRAHAAGARIVEVTPGSFSHGGTRQLGAGLATGDCLLFTVQDAVPATDYLLYKMARVLKHNPDVMVVSARQMTNRETDLYSRWSVDVTYSSFGLSSDLKYTMRYPELFDHLPQQTKRTISFVDNVCACYRADAIREFCFAKIENAEDIEIGTRFIKAGHHLGFLHTAGVYHWHPLPSDYFLKRSFIGVKSMVEILHHPIPDLESLQINCFADVARRSATLYEAVKISLNGLKGSEHLTHGDIVEFASRMNATLTNFAGADRLNVGGSPALEAVLKAIGAEIGRLHDSSLIKANHLIIGFTEHLRSLASFIMANNGSVPVSKKDFADALYKIAATRIGDLVGQWYMKLLKEGRHSDMEPIKTLLLKGICTS